MPVSALKSEKHFWNALLDHSNFRIETYCLTTLCTAFFSPADSVWMELSGRRHRQIIVVTHPIFNITCWYYTWVSLTFSTHDIYVMDISSNSPKINISKNEHWGRCVSCVSPICQLIIIIDLNFGVSCIFSSLNCTSDMVI